VVAAEGGRGPGDEAAVLLTHRLGELLVCGEEVLLHGLRLADPEQLCAQPAHRPPLR
jgi:hypothetical protein